MSRDTEFSWNRRRVLQITGGATIGVAGVSQTGFAAKTDAHGAVTDEPDPGTPESGVEFIDADPDAGFNYPYYLYTPERDEYESELPLLVEPNNTGASTDDFDEHLEMAEQLITEQIPGELASRLNIPALVPVFPRPREDPVDWRHYTQQLDAETLSITDGDLERIDLQLLRMIDHARTLLSDRSEPVTTDGVLLNGFSASGNFADRFTMLHPEEVLSVTAGGLNGMAVLPLKEVDNQELPYPVGITDVEELTGDSPDLDALSETRQFLYMGGDDENDTIPFEDAWSDDDLRQVALDVYGEDMIDDRFPRSEELYEEAGVDAEFRVYEGAGHTPVPALDDIVKFHQQTVDEYRITDDDSAADTDDPQSDAETDESSAETTDEDPAEEAAAETADDEIPGFGVVKTIAALSGAGYLLKNRVTGTKHPEQ